MLRYDYFVRWGVLALVALGTAPAPASAEPVEWSAFFGADKLPKDLALGGSVDPEQRPQTGPLLGGRLTWLPLASHWVSAGVEGELSLTTTWTGYGFTSRRQSYFAPVLGYRASAVVQGFPLALVRPHLLAGGGGASTASYSPYMNSESVGVYYWGAGVSISIGDSWHLRIDGRQVWVPATSGNREASYEIQIGLGRVITRTLPVIELPPRPLDDVSPNPDEHPAVPTPAPTPTPTPTPVPAPVAVPVPVPAPVPAPAPVPVPAPVPAPVAAPLPPAAAAAFDAASAVRFETSKARITAAGKLSLAKTLKVLRDHSSLKITITGHDADASLAKKRAEAVKWYLVDQGIAEDQIETATGDPAKTPISIAARP